MFYFPMVFMLIVTLTSLVFTIKAQIVGIMAGGALTLANGLQLVLAGPLAVLAVVLAIKGARAVSATKRRKSPSKANKESMGMKLLKTP